MLLSPPHSGEVSRAFILQRLPGSGDGVRTPVCVPMVEQDVRRHSDFDRDLAAVAGDAVVENAASSRHVPLLRWH
jgi:hypothetical protein